MDQVEPAVRSRMMRAIKGKDTGPERAVRAALHTAGYRYRLHRRDLPGSPDIVLPRFRIAVQVNGCFWHRHDCKKGRRTPSSNANYWGPKLAKNRQRQMASNRALVERGWKVAIVWECQIEQGISELKRLLRRSNPLETNKRN
ncbi:MULTISPECIES: very short patch repair endonuclease [Bradyrhizobium]|uniref:very short patch repair endonuclease n=1 Tax=Bradyrhizobium TaxID=374 RepID=UPI0009BAED80|nr:MULTISPECIES: very short patch repair endonuclease [Bradyrhizobium]